MPLSRQGKLFGLGAQNEIQPMRFSHDLFIGYNLNKSTNVPFTICTVLQAVCGTQLDKRD